MQTTALLDRNNHAFLFGYLVCSLFEEPKIMKFMIDTGSTVTTILSDYAAILGIDCGNLRKSTTPTATANGLVFPYILQPAQILLRVEYGFLNRNKDFGVFDLEEIQCMRPTNPTSLTPQRRHHAKCILGMDVLKHFKKWEFRNRKLILKT